MVVIQNTSINFRLQKWKHFNWICCSHYWKFERIKIRLPLSKSTFGLLLMKESVYLLQATVHNCIIVISLKFFPSKYQDPHVVYRWILVHDCTVKVKRLDVNCTLCGFDWSYIHHIRVIFVFFVVIPRVLTAFVKLCYWMCNHPIDVTIFHYCDIHTMIKTWNLRFSKVKINRLIPVKAPRCHSSGIIVFKVLRKKRIYIHTKAINDDAVTGAWKLKSPWAFSLVLCENSHELVEIKPFSLSLCLFWKLVNEIVLLRPAIE